MSSSTVGPSLSKLVGARINLCREDVETLDKVTSIALDRFSDLSHPAALVADFLGATQQKQGEYIRMS